MRMLLVLFSIVTANLFADDPLANATFLGFTNYKGVCQTWVKNGGFERMIYGAVVGLEFREDACFGVTATTGTTEVEISADALKAKMKVSAFVTTLKSDLKYDSLWDRTDKLMNTVNILYSAASDGLSKASLQPFYRDMKFEYEMLTYDYYPLHTKVQNPKVGESWKQSATAIEKLKKDFEG